MLPLLFAGIVLLLKKAVFLGKFAIFVTGLLGVGGLSGIGQFNGINNYQPQRPHLFGQNNHHSNNGFGTFGDPTSNGYYKSDPKQVGAVQYQDVAVHEKDHPQYADQFYNYENKVTISKADNKELKSPANRSARANGYRNFVWQSN